MALAEPVGGFDANASSEDPHKAGAGKDARPLLFDLKDDPLENVNIAAKGGKHVDRLSRFFS